MTIQQKVFGKFSLKTLNYWILRKLPRTFHPQDNEQSAPSFMVRKDFRNH